MAWGAGESLSEVRMFAEESFVLGVQGSLRVSLDVMQGLCLFRKV